MQFIKSVAGLVWGSGAETPELAGTLYDLHTGKWRTLYNICRLTVRPCSTPHKFELVAMRDPEEVEAERESEDPDALPESFAFPLDEKAFIVAGKSPLGEPALLWQSMREHDLTRIMLEVSDDVHAPSYESFCLSVARALYESSHNAPAPPTIDQSELLALLSPGRKPPKTETKPADVKPTDTMPACKYKPRAAAPTGPPPRPVTGLEGKTLVRAPVSLYMYDSQKSAFALLKEEASVAIQQVTKFGFLLCVLEEPEGKLVISQAISNDIFPFFNMAERSMIWIYRLNETVWTWSVCMRSEQDDEAVKDCFARCLYETNAQSSFSKCAPEDQRFFVGSLRDKDESLEAQGFEKPTDLTEEDLMDFGEMVVVEDDEELEETLSAISVPASVPAPAKPAPAPARTPAKPLAKAAAREESEDEDEESEEESEEEDDVDEDEDDEDENSEDEEEDGKDVKNKLLAVAGNNEHAFVARGRQIGVFQATRDSKIKYRAKIRALPFSPRKMMLHDREEKMVLLSPTDKKSMFHMDLEAQKIVSEWKADDNYPVNELVPQDKYAQQSSTQPFVGINRVGFFLLDPRQSGNKIVNDRKFFSVARTAPGFLCAATTTKGQIVIGTEKGEVRLYDQKMLSRPGPEPEARQPRAKTTYPGLGSPVIGIDVTGDGKWILATCKTFLFVVPAELPDGKSGFEKPLGKDKGIARRLQLKPEHIAQMGGSVSFTPAKFNTVSGGGSKERAIVTSTSDFVVTWNFNRVKQNLLDQYVVNQVAGEVVADQFRFGDADTVVVAMPDDVAIAKKTLPESFRYSMAPSPHKK